MIYKIKITLMLFSLLFIISCATDSIKIPLYQGYDFDAKINNANVIKLDDSTKITTLKGYRRDVNWQLDKPINGNIKAYFRANKNSEKYIGRIKSMDNLQIIALTPVNIETTKGLKSDSTVQINGGAAVTMVNVLKKNYLPKGDYVFRVKVFGTHNWDRKEVYVQVR